MAEEAYTVRVHHEPGEEPWAEVLELGGGPESGVIRDRPSRPALYSQRSGSLARASAERPVVMTSIPALARLSGGTTSTRSAVPPSIPLWPRVRVACQRPPLCCIASTEMLASFCLGFLVDPVPRSRRQCGEPRIHHTRA